MKQFILLILVSLIIAIKFFGQEFPAAFAKEEIMEQNQEDKEKSAQSRLVNDGAALFELWCSVCHYADRTETKFGPGLKGLFRRANLPVSGLAVTEANVRKTLKTPFNNMTPFPDLPEEQIAALIAFLKTL